MAPADPAALPLPSRRLQWVVTGLLGLGLTALDPALPLSWPTIVLVAMAALKLREARRRAERRLVALLQLVGVGLLGAQQPDLLPSALQLLITVAALAGLLELELELGLSWRQLLRRSAQVLAAALPMALVLFLLLPRIGPLWTLPQGWGGAAVTGLSDRLDPGGIATLASSDAPAARVAFSDNRVPPEPERYWRVLVHERFDGRAWQRQDPQPAARWRAASETRGERQLWLVEPGRFQAVPWDGRAQPRSDDLKLRLDGELLLQRPPRERRNYQLSNRDQPAPWQRRPPTLLDLQLLQGTQPRLEALGRSWATIPDPRQRLAAAEAWFRSQPFRYSRTPGTLPARAGLDVFLFERREGFCGHYASAFTALMRAAGVPARVVSGYRGGVWVQPLGGDPYLDIRQSDAHAWSEVWLPAEGWVEVDPTTWIRGGSATANGGAALQGLHGPAWWLWGQRQWWGLDLAWSRWWLGFDQEGQAALLERLLGPRREWLGPLVLLGLGGGLALGLAWMHWAQGRRDRAPRADRARRELDSSLRALRRRGLEPAPAETLEQFCSRAAATLPELATDLQNLADTYLNLRFAETLPTGRGDQSHLRRLILCRRRINRRLAQASGSA
jgi:transglutaminase-like putative cysteine protease